MSTVKSVAQELKREASELIRAERRLPTTSPRSPTGRRLVTMVGKTMSPRISPFAPVGMRISPLWCSA
jgi:hypothetical protein